ncbi:receptor activity-modifying protein 2 isoform X2 [Eleutherodactylus coqui]
MAAVENATQSTGHESHFNRTRANMTDIPYEIRSFGSMAAVENATQSTGHESHVNKTSVNMTDIPYEIRYQYYKEEVEYCWNTFNNSMFTLKYEYWCNWKHIVSIYNELQVYLERSADFLLIGFPNEAAHDTILKAHMHYFKNCSPLFEELQDPPENILFGLIFAPICIIPFLITLVVYKSNTSKPQT